MAGRASIRLENVAGELRRLPRSSMIAAAKAVKQIALQEARAATGDGRMSGVGRRGAKLRAVDTISEHGDLVVCVIKGVPAGPWSMVTDGARAHDIKPRRRRGKRKGVMGGGLAHPVSGVVHHPGSRGRGAWRQVITRAERVVPAIFADDVHRAVS